MDAQVRDAIRQALGDAEYPMSAGELRRAVRTVGVFGEEYLTGQLDDMAQAGEVARDQPHEREFWYLVPPPWAAESERGTA